MNFFIWLKDNIKITILILLGSNILFLLLSGIMTYLYFNKESICPEIALPTNNITIQEDSNELKKLQVEIKGAVNNPGVYEINEGNIINDLVNLAGGLKKEAYTNNINFSRKLSNEMVVYIYTKNEYKKNNTIVVEKPCVCPSYDISNCTDNKQSEIIADDSIETNINNDTLNQKININTASKNELTKLKGIGASKADAIIEYRTSHGKFEKIEDLKNVNGIGDSTFDKIKDDITV